MKKIIPIFVICFSFSCCLVYVPALADNFDITPSIVLRQEYNNNIFFNADDEVSDSISTIIAGLEVSNRNERIDFILSGLIAPFFYRKNSELNEIDMGCSGGLSYQFTPLIDTGMNAAYLIENRPDRDLLETGLALSSNTRRRLTLGGNTEIVITEKMNCSLYYDFLQDKWDGDDPDLFDMNNHSGGIGLEYDLGKWINSTKGLLDLGFLNYDYRTSDTLSLNFTAGFHHFFNELFSLSFDVGGRYTDSSYDILEIDSIPPANNSQAIVEKSYKHQDGIGAAVLRYRGRTTRYRLTTSHDLVALSGRLGPNRLTRFVFDFLQGFWGELSWGLSTGYYINKANPGEYSALGIDRNSFRVRPYLRWEFIDGFMIEGAYGYSYGKDNLSQSEGSQHLAYFQISYGFSLMEMSSRY